MEQFKKKILALFSRCREMLRSKGAKIKGYFCTRPPEMGILRQRLFNRAIQNLRGLYKSGPPRIPNSNVDDDGFWKNPGLKKIRVLITNKTSHFFYFLSKWSDLLAPLLRKIDKKLFSPEHRNHVHKATLVLAVAITAYILGKVFALIAGGTFSKPPPSGGILVSVVSEDDLAKNIENIKTHNLFHAKLISDEGKKNAIVIDDNIICSESTQVSGLPIKLMNTIVLQTAIKSLAAIQVESESEIKSIREGDKISGMASIDKIERLRIIIKNLQTGVCEYIANQEMSSNIGHELNILSPKEGKKLLAKAHMEGVKNEGDKYYISRKLINEKLQELDSLLTQAKAIQMPNPDGTISFKITELVPGSIFAYLGIEENDKIVGINGKKITALNEVINLFGMIQNMDFLQLSVVKEDGAEKQMEYSFAK